MRAVCDRREQSHRIKDEAKEAAKLPEGAALLEAIVDGLGPPPGHTAQVHLEEVPLRGPRRVLFEADREMGEGGLAAIAGDGLAVVTGSGAYRRLDERPMGEDRMTTYLRAR